MDILWLIIGIVLMLGGMVGCFLPVLPGPPLSFIALLILQLRSEPPFTANFLIVWGLIAAAVTALDYIIPSYGTKKFGGSSYGIWGCNIGLLLGLWAGPVGMLLGPFLGAFIGEMMAANNSEKALKAAFGSFMGFIAGTVIKLAVCGVMAYYFVVGVW
jgi:uncharacterized protein